MFGVRHLLKQKFGPENRQSDSRTPPWFDQPDALKILEARRKQEFLSDRDFESLRHWAQYGYILARDLVPNEDVDGMMSDLDNVWTTDIPFDNLIIDDLRVKPDDPPGVSHRTLVTLDRPTRERLRRECRWRIHEFISQSKNARRIFDSSEVARICSLILGRQANPSYTINFAFGSTQDLHQDTAVFSVFPMNYIIGAWLACEDIHPDSGPLVYYPESHKEKLFTGFVDYPFTQLKNCDPKTTEAYYRYLEQISQRYERKTFIARKGEWFLWHGMMIHGGDAIRNPGLTRRSYVCHYIPPGMNREADLKGPFNW